MFETLVSPLILPAGSGNLFSTICVHCWIPSNIKSSESNATTAIEKDVSGENDRISECSNYLFIKLVLEG